MKYFIIIIFFILIILGIYLFKNSSKNLNANKNNSSKKLQSKKIKDEERRCFILGYGPVGQTLLPVLLENLNFKEYIILDQTDIDIKKLDDLFTSKAKNNKKIKYTYIKKHIDYGKIVEQLSNIFEDKDLVFNLVSRVESVKVMEALSTKKDCLYLDAGMEDQLEEETIPEVAIQLKAIQFAEKKLTNSTYVVDTGMNPGMISHFAILGVLEMAKQAIKLGVKDSKKIQELLDKKDLSGLAMQLEIHTIHVSEYESMNVYDPKKIENNIISSWSLASFTEEFFFQGCASKGTNDAEFFKEKNYEDLPYDNRPKIVKLPFPLHMKTSYPFGTFTGRLVEHPELVQISNIFSNNQHNITTVFVYKPSAITRKQLYKFKDNWTKMPQRIFSEETDGPLSGFETVGATIISGRKEIPNRYYGSIVTCEEARRAGAKTNPTVIQVIAGLYSHAVLALKNPYLGMIWPHSFDSEEIMKYAMPYVGKIYNINLPEKLPYKFNELLSTEEEMNDDL